MPVSSDAYELPEPPDIDHIEISDDTPVENLFAERERSLLVQPLYSGLWSPPEGRFVAMADVGLFASLHEPPLCPDMMLSLGVEIHPDAAREKRKQTYFVWEFGKVPDVVVEVVGNKKGGELDRKLDRYARMRILYYAVMDPYHFIQKERLVVYELDKKTYVPRADFRMPEVGLQLVEWEGEYLGMQATWIRWATIKGELLPTGPESTRFAQAAQGEAEAERAKAEAERAKAEAERAKADALAAKLRELGVEPDDL